MEKARFFDGKQLKPFEAQLSITQTGLSITFEQAGTPTTLSWPVTTLQIMSRPLGGREAVIASTTTEGARLIVSGPLYLEILPLVSRKNIKLSEVHHPFHKMIGLFLISIIFVLSALWELPRMAPFIAKKIPYVWDQKLGHYVIKEIAHTHKECVFAQGRLALNKMITELTQHLDLEHPFDVKVIQFSNNNINAFAVPGFQIVIMSGLLHFTEEPDELAGVLAHEMGHALEHHPTQSLIREIGLQVIMHAAFGTSFEVANQIIISTHSRNDEYQADQIATRLLQQINVSPKGLIHFFEKIHNRYGDLQSISPFLNYISSHPALIERIRKIQPTTNAAHPQPILTTKEWHALKAICQETRDLDLNTH